MKRRDLEKTLVKIGWWFLRHGGSHDIWTNGVDIQAIPRHSEIDNFVARKILRQAKQSRGV